MCGDSTWRSWHGDVVVRRVVFLFSLFFFFFSFACSLHLRSCSLSPLVVFAAMRFCRKKIEQEEGMVVDRLLLLLERGGDVVGVVVADRCRCLVGCTNSKRLCVGN